MPNIFTERAVVNVSDDGSTVDFESRNETLRKFPLPNLFRIMSLIDLFGATEYSQRFPCHEYMVHYSAVVSYTPPANTNDDGIEVEEMIQAASARIMKEAIWGEGHGKSVQAVFEEFGFRVKDVSPLLTDCEQKGECADVKTTQGSGDGTFSAVAVAVVRTRINT